MAFENHDKSLGIDILQTLICSLPHLVVESSGYILIAMSEVFLSQAITRYSFQSSLFLEVGTAVMNILTGGFLMLLIAATLDEFWAPNVIQFMFCVW